MAAHQGGHLVLKSLEGAYLLNLMGSHQEAATCSSL